MDYTELSNEQRRQLIDAQQAFAVWRTAALELEALGTLRVQSSKGRRYMYQVHGTVRKSLGPKTAALLKRKAQHDARRADLETRVRTLAKRIANAAPVNRALGLGRMRTIAARIVRQLDREQLLGSHVIIAGTNALHAYETATGTLISHEHVATTDADIIWDTRQSLLLAATGIRRDGLMGVLRKVDQSFVADYGFNAKNRDGYIVDLLCPETDDFTTMKAGPDLEATAMQGPNGCWLRPNSSKSSLARTGTPFASLSPSLVPSPCTSFGYRNEMIARH